MDSEYFKALLNDRDLKATSPRLALLAEMKAFETAMPFSAIQAAMKSTDRVTLYRNLDALSEQGVIHKAFQENNEVYYALCGKQCVKDKHHHDHIHFKCLQCKSVTCEQLDNVMELSLANYEIHSIAIHLKGVCKVCVEKNAAA